MTITPEQIEQGWKPHDGGPKPVGTKYPMELLFRDGQADVATHAREFEWRSAAYRHGRDIYPDGHFADIIAYREVQP